MMDMADWTAVSLFDGIGGFPAALSTVGIRTVVTVEIDRAASGVTADRFPDARQLSDVTEVTPDDLYATGFVPERGIVTAGWPCQDLSPAGRRLGLDGTRSGLFWEIVRLAAGLRPRWLVLENVPGLLSAVCACPGLGVCGQDCADPHPVRGGACGPGRCMELHGGAMGAVLGALGGLGYGFAYRVLDAQYFGVPQRRRRVVLVANLGDWAAPAAVLLEPDSGPGDPAARGAAGPDLAGGVAVSTLQGGGRRGYRVDAESAAGGHLIPHVAYSLTARASMDRPESKSVTLIPHTTHALTAEGANASEDGTGRGTPIVAFGHTRGLDIQPSETHTPTIRAGNGGGHAVMEPISVRRLTPVECERLQGFPDDWTATSGGRPQSDSARYRQLGNSIAVPVFAWVARRIVAYEAGEL